MATIEELLQANKELTAQIAVQQQQIAVQQQQIDWLKRQLFGRKSEAFDHPDLFTLEDEDGNAKIADTEDDAGPRTEDNEQEKNPDTGEKKTRPIRKARLPENLPVIIIKEIIPDEVQASPGDWREIGEEHSDQLEKAPGYFYISRIIRRKFVRIDNPFAPPVIAPAPLTLIDNGFWGAGLLSEILANKYLYHLPLYRQQQLYQCRFDIDLPRNTMGSAVELVSDQLQAVVDQMITDMIRSGYLQIDETPVRYLDPGHPNGSAMGYLWTYRSGTGEVVFDWRITREHGNLDTFFESKANREVLAMLDLIQSDGYEAYDSFIARQALLDNPIKRIACMAHIRRKFEQAAGQYPEIARWFLRQIARLYRIEDTLRENKAPPELRHRLRQQQSLRIMNLIEKAIDHLLTNSTKILTSSNLGQALKYARGQWAAMRVYLDHGQVEIDNNLVENAIRPTAVGKKNHLFFVSPEAGKRSATLYSLLLSAKAQGVDPQAYLRDLIERLPTTTTSGLKALTPANWAAAHKAKIAAAKQDASADGAASVA